MTTDIVNNEAGLLLGEDWCSPLETSVRVCIRGLIEELLEEELSAALGRARYVRLTAAPASPADGAQGLGDEGQPADTPAATKGTRNGLRERTILGTFGPVTIAVPRARLATAAGKTTEWVGGFKIELQRPDNCDDNPVSLRGRQD